MHTRNLSVDQIRKELELHTNQNGFILEISDLLCEKLGSYGGCNGLYYSQAELAELVYFMWRKGRGYEIGAIVNEIYDMRNGR